MRYFRDEGVVRIRVCEHRAYGEQDLADSEGRGPLVLQYVQANGAVGVYIRMVNASRKINLGRLERVVRRKVDVQEEDTASVGRVGGAHNGGLPVEQVVANGSGTAGGRGITAEVLEFLGYALEGHEC